MVQNGSKGLKGGIKLFDFKYPPRPCVGYPKVVGLRILDGTCLQIVSGLPMSADMRIRGVQPFRDLRRGDSIDFFLCMGMLNFLFYLEITSGDP